MGRIFRPHSLETNPLKITARQLPCNASLLANIERRYSHSSSTSLGVASDNRELLLTLAHKHFFRQEPAAAAVSLDENTSKWPVMSNRQGALLKWLLQSLAYWEVSYPLEEELRDQFRALLPLLAQRALDDQNFTVPGAHPLHRIFDTLQSEAVGWQPGQGRAGDTLQRNLLQAIDSMRQALEQGEDLALGQLAAQLEQAAQAEERRAARMVQRLIEKEQGQQKTFAARNTAAHRINASLSRQSLPAPVGRFIKGPWYHSAQLVLLKFGEQSEQWQQMCDTTNRLAASMLPRDVLDADTQSREEALERLKTLPAELRRWLFSLQHDEDAITEAVGLIEFAHLRLLRQQALPLYPIEPLPTTVEDSASAGITGSIANLEPGQWFLIRGDGPRSSQRAQLTVKLYPQQQLLFNNRAGMKAFSISYSEFDRALSQKTARVLNREGSFSLSLLRAAGLTEVEQLDELQGLQESAPVEPQESEETGSGGADRGGSDDPAAIDIDEAALLETLDLQQSGDKTHLDPITQSRAESEPLGLPMGTWLGFHDCDPPMLAKLAAHDREQGLYIFVNRRGIKQRQLSKRELLALAEQDLVDIFASRTNFRDHVSRLKSTPPG